MIRILVVEDNSELNKSLCVYLNECGYEATGCLEAEAAFDELYEKTYNLIISDIMMPNIDGYEFAKEVRSTNPDIPILFMTAREDFDSKRRAFNIGIDDYMTKPVNLEELVLRIEALLRRTKINTSQEIVIGNLRLNALERSATYNNEEIVLTTREFNIIFKLLSYPKKTFTRTQLMEEFWDVETMSGPRTVDVYMTKLRDKFSEVSEISIKTVHGMGYKVVINEEK